MKRFGIIILTFVLALTTFSFACAEYSLSAEKTSYEILKDESVCLEYTFTKNGQPANVEDLEFTSNDTSVATVDSTGKVFGVGVGWATITASYGKQKVEFSVRVKYVATSLNISDTAYGLLCGETIKVKATAQENYQDKPDAQIVYEIADTSVATVDANGVITAIKQGETTLEVKWKKLSKTLPVYVVQTATADEIHSFSQEHVNLFGRVYLEGNALCTTQTSSGLEFMFKGSTLKGNIQTSYNTPYINCFIDGQEATRIKLDSGTKEYVLAEGLNEGYHKVRIVKTSEVNEGKVSFKKFTAQGFAKVAKLSDISIEFVGDSITSGYGALGKATDSRTMDNSDSSCSYAYKTAELLNANFSVVARQGICVGATYNTTDRMLDLYKKTCYNVSTATTIYSNEFDVVVINLGTNDAEYLKKNNSEQQQFVKDYISLLEIVREKNPNAYIVCLYGIMGKEGMVDNGIKNAVAQMQDAKIVYNPISTSYTCSGPGGHPNQYNNNVIAYDLANYIQTLLK